MPRLPMPPDEVAYQKNTKEQYEALGRFVEAFEHMVSETRHLGISLLGGDTNELVSIALHHQALSAKPLFEIWRAAVAEIVADGIKPPRENARPLKLDAWGQRFTCTPTDRDQFHSVLANIASEYNDLANTRNNLLHATWFIGYAGAEDPNATEFHVRKFAATKTGLSPLVLPKKATELTKLADRCVDTRYWIGNLHDCLGNTSRIGDRFQIIEKRWHLCRGNDKSTLPEK